MGCTSVEDDRAWTVVSESPEATRALGRFLGQRLGPGDFIALIGDLGSGKTALCMAILEGLGVRRPAGSPTFILIQEYQVRFPVLHADVYRLDDPAELDQLGLVEAIDAGVILMEWADRARALWPPSYLEVQMAVAGENQRRLIFCPVGDRFAALVEAIADAGFGHRDGHAGLQRRRS